jgi:hypothetical protein
MKKLRVIVIFLMSLAPMFALAQQKPSDRSQQPRAAAQPTEAEDISGMYTFLREGEFVQVTVEDGDRVSGFVSRYGDSDSDKGTFLDQFFSKAALKDKHLTFTTKPIHGVWFDFDGTVERGPGKTPHNEAYRVLRGTLTQLSEDLNKKTSSKSRQVEFKSFPQDLDEDVPQKP